MDTAPIPENEQVLWRFLDKVNHDSPRMAPADIEPLHAAGWADEQFYYAITVVALFTFHNRWIDATGMHALSDEEHREGAKRSAIVGYVRKSKPAATASRAVSVAPAARALPVR